MRKRYVAKRILIVRSFPAMSVIWRRGMKEIMLLNVREMD